MYSKVDLELWLLEALKELGGSAHHIRIAERIWAKHASDLRVSGDLLFTWQYDLRWAAQRLRGSGELSAMEGRRDGVWNLADKR
jgi:hypothetical protein